MIRGDNLEKILGIDEAGRGPVIGPMVMCGYLVREDRLEKLREIGVKDSKALSPGKREELFPEIRRLAEKIIVLRISAGEIDSLRMVTNLNKLEIDRMRSMIKALEPDVAVIDAPEANTKKFREKVSRGIKAKIIAENFADRKYAEVGAASIIAKVTRDREIAKLHRKYGFFGSGYTSDSRTIAFLKDWLQNNKGFPDFVRKSWITAILMKKEREQKRLLQFAGS